jgi:hypothetical protein
MDVPLERGGLLVSVLLAPLRPIFIDIALGTLLERRHRYCGLSGLRFFPGFPLCLDDVDAGAHLLPRGGA